MTEFRQMRRFKQQISQNECADVLTKEKRGVLAVNGEGGYPYAVPINFLYDDKTQRIFFHGARSGHKFDALKADGKVCFTVYEQGEQRGDWSYYVRSVIVFGRIHFIEDNEVAISYVRKMAYKYYPEGSGQTIEDDIKRNGGRMQMLELIHESITGKLVHEQ